MENASKALIIAGAILVALAVISFGVLIFTRLSSNVKQDSTLDKQEIAVFNSKLQKYVGPNVSGAQVNELIQYVFSINKNAEKLGNNRTVTIKKDGATFLSKNASKTKNVPTGVFYTVEIKSYNSNGLISVLEIK